MTPLPEFWDMLKKHDWTHEMSDDHSVWRRGNAEQVRLMGISKESPEHEALFNSMGDWGWNRGELPPRPEV